MKIRKFYDSTIESPTIIVSVNFLWLQEIIQNAEDAGATKLIFLSDDTTYGTDKLHIEDLASYQVQN